VLWVSYYTKLSSASCIWCGAAPRRMTAREPHAGFGDQIHRLRGTTGCGCCCSTAAARVGLMIRQKNPASCRGYCRRARSRPQLTVERQLADKLGVRRWTDHVRADNEMADSLANSPAHKGTARRITTACRAGMLTFVLISGRHLPIQMHIPTVPFFTMFT
jgi:hypothetical protein